MVAIDEGQPELEIAREMPTAWARNLRAFDRYSLLTTRPRSWPTHTTVLWGPPGSGKSARAQREMPDAYWVSRGNGNAAWYDGYDRHEDLVIDEFFGWISRDMMCRVCDRYPLTLQTKGGSRQCQLKRVIITSNAHPRVWWRQIGLGAFERRIDVLEYVDYSAAYPCLKPEFGGCGVFPHGPDCTFTPPEGAPPTASRGPKAAVGYVGADGQFVPLLGE